MTIKVVVEIYGSNGAEDDWEIEFDTDSQKEVISIWKSLDEDCILPEDHPKIIHCSEFSDEVLDAGGMSQQFKAIYQNGIEIEPMPELAEWFS